MSARLARQCAPSLAPDRTEVARLLAACVARSIRSDTWASRARNFSAELGGVPCNVHVKAQALRQVVGSASRVTGELFVYVTSSAGADGVGGIGWLHFVAAESAVEHCAYFYDIAFAEALGDLRAKPHYQALGDQTVLDRSTRISAESRDIGRRRL